MTNHSTGDDIKDLLIDLDVEADDLRREILARVTKTGKTLSVIYGQAANCAIDSCVIFVPLRREGGLSRPQVFVDGVAAWLAPYGLGKDFEWRSRPPLNLYVNLSLFGEIAEELAGQRGGLGGWTDLKLRFANKDCVDFFFTSNKFHPCKLQEWQKAKIEDDDEFSAAFLSGGGRDSLRALFSDPEGIGSDYMFNCLSSITADKRKQLYSSILKADVDMVLSVIAEARPEDVGERERRQEDILRAIAVRLEDALSGGTPAEEKKRMVTFLKRVLMLNPADLTPLMIRPKKCPDEEVGDYLRRQFQKWVADRASEISGDTLAGELLESPAADGQLFLEALACCSEKDTIAGFKELFGFVSDDEDAASARYPLATMMVNVLMCGSILNNVQYDVAVDDPVNISSEDMLIAPMYSRVCRLLDGGLNPNRRPHLFGDEEIDDLARTLAQN